MSKKVCPTCGKVPSKEHLSIVSIDWFELNSEGVYEQVRERCPYCGTYRSVNKK